MARALRDGRSTARVNHVGALGTRCSVPPLPGARSGESGLCPARLCSGLCYAQHLPRGGAITVFVLFLEASQRVLPASLFSAFFSWSLTFSHDYFCLK